MSRVLSRIGHYLGDKFVDQIVGVLFTFGLTAAVATIQQLAFPTIPLGYVFLIVAIAAFLGAFLIAFVQSRFRKKTIQRNAEVQDPSKIPLIEPTEKPVSGFSPEQERRFLKFGFHSLIQRQLIEIERRLVFQYPKPIQFSSWNDFQEDVKKQYIDDHRTYEIIEKIAKVLDTWNEAVNRADLLRVQPNSGTIHLCIQGFHTYHDKLKEHGFLI